MDALAMSNYRWLGDAARAGSEKSPATALFGQPSHNRRQAEAAGTKTRPRIAGRSGRHGGTAGAIKLRRGRAGCILGDACVRRPHERPADGEQRPSKAEVWKPSVLSLDLYGAAHGILQIVNYNMMGAIRNVSVERGYDPRNFALVTFGGPGPMHSISVARLLDMATVIAPQSPGVASAYGLLVADFKNDYATRDYMDNDGVGTEWHSFHLELSSTGDRVTLDATKSDDQAPGSINFMASDGTIGAYFGQHFHQYDPSLTMNHGLLAAVDEVKLRPGSILRPQWPAALGCRAHTFTKLKNAVLAVVARASGGKSMAATAVYVIAYWRMKDAESGEWMLCTDGIAVGHGARPHVDGIDAIYSRHNENYPAEFMDMEYPLRMERYAINPNSAGPGKYRGGCGIIRDVRLLAPEGTFGLRVEYNRFPAWGVAGGKAGGTSQVLFNPGSDGEREIRPFSDDNPWQAGDVVRIYSAGGGGWGDPLEREIPLVEKDVRGGFVSLASARSEYGVVIDPETLKADGPGTLAFRNDLRQTREQPKLFHRFIYFDEEE